MAGKNRDSADRDNLIAQHLNLPRAVAREVRGPLARAINLEELIASGNLGLVEAADRFDPGRGVKFSTLAWTRIRGAMIDGLRSTGQFRRAEVARYRKEAANDIGDARPISLKSKPEPTDTVVPEIEEELDLRRLIPRLGQALEQLPERERIVARLHYFEGLQLNEIAARLGLSKSYVTRIHQRTLQQLHDDMALPLSSDVTEAA
jgi:RNA polymerase sigma factor for flagellar operon FliA